MLLPEEYVVLWIKEEIISKIQWWTGTVGRADNLKEFTGVYSLEAQESTVKYPDSSIRCGTIRSPL
jgi:hypothetical protein